MQKKKEKIPFIQPSIQKGVRKSWRPLENGTTEWWRDFRRFMREPSCPGSAFLEPEKVKAGQLESLKLVFRVGKGGILPYGHIAIECPIRDLKVWTPRIHLKAKDAVISVNCSNPKPELDVTYSAGIIDIMNRAYSLEEGDKVEVLLGDSRGNPAPIPLFAQKYPFPIAVDRENSGVYRRIAQFPALEVIGSYAQRFYVVVRPTQSKNRPFYIKVRPIDELGNPASGYEGKIKFTCSDHKGVLPPHHCLKREENQYILSKVRLSTPGVHTIAVIDERRGIGGLSNPVLVDESHYGPYNLFFGDIHGHNVYCDGRGTADEYYRWGRDIRFLDFSALTNHVEGAKRFPAKDFWNLVKAKAAEYNDPGRFVTFLAFEWGGWDLFGDKCVYYLSDEGDYFPANEERSNTPEKLWNLLRGKDALTIAHHTKYGGKTDWTFHDNELQPLVEIYSIWGSSENGGEHSVQKAWEKGYRLGIIASSDNHTGTPGNKGEGLAAVWAHDLTRKSLFEAFSQRRCYGTTGARIILDFRLNGHMMGEVLTLKNNRNRKISVLAAGTAPVEKIEVLRNNHIVYLHVGSGTVERFEWEDESGGKPLPFGGEFYYIRVTQMDGEMAWSSPIWLSS